MGIPVKGYQDELRTDKIKRAVELYEWAINDDQNIIRQLKSRLRKSNLINEDTYNRFPAWNYINGIPKILNIICTLYYKAPIRYVVTNGQIDEKHTKLLNEYISNSNLNEACSEALKLAWLYKVARIMPIIRNNQIEFDVLLPFQTELEPEEDNPYKLKNLAILNEVWSKNKMERIIVVWTSNEHFIYDANLNKLPIEKNGKSNNYINPYGTIPIATLWLETTDIWGDPEYKLVEHYASNSLINIWKDYVSFFHAGGIPVISNADMEGSSSENMSNRNIKINGIDISSNRGEKNFRLSPDSLIQLNSDLAQQANFKFETPQSNLELLQHLIDWDTNKNLSLYNIPKNAFLADRIPESGYSKMIDEIEIVNARKRHLLACSSMEKELFEVIKIILNYNYNVKFPDNSTIKVDYAEYDFIKSPNEAAHEMELSIKYNIKSPIDYILQSNPELSIQEAENIFNYNLKINSNLGQSAEPRGTRILGTRYE
jgi:hypothetical protein